MINNCDTIYCDMLKHIMANGKDKTLFGHDNVYIRSVFGYQTRYQLDKFPLLTTKKMFTRGIIHELLWFISGSSNIKYLADNDVHIWDEWAYKAFNKANPNTMTQQEFIAHLKSLPKDDPWALEWGDLGNVYGVQWRRWKGSDGREIDQLMWAIEKLKRTPERKSIVVSAWNPEFIYEMALPGKSMALPPCHTLYQFDVREGKLSLQLYQRSADAFLGVPFNISSYALFTCMIAQVVGLEPGEFIHTFGDVHIYSNHFEQVEEQVTRTPYESPTLWLNPEVKNIDDYKLDDIKLVDYTSHPTLKGDITVIGGF